MQRMFEQKGAGQTAGRVLDVLLRLVQRQARRTRSTRAARPRTSRRPPSPSPGPPRASRRSCRSTASRCSRRRPWRPATRTTSSPRVRASPTRRTRRPPSASARTSSTSTTRPTRPSRSSPTTRTTARSRRREDHLQDRPRRVHPSSGAAGRLHRRLRPAEPGRLEGSRGRRQQGRDPPGVQHPLHGLNAWKNPKLKDLRVRQAIAIGAQPRPDGQDPAARGREGRASQFMPDTVAGYNTSLKPYAYDVEKAKALLKEAGAEGMTLQFAFPTEVSGRTCRTRRRSTRPSRRTSRPPASRSRSSASRGTVATSTTPTPTSSTRGCSGGRVTTTPPTTSSARSSPTSRRTTSAPSAYPWGKTLASDLKKADAIVDEAEREAAYQKINQQIAEEYLPGHPDQPLPAGPRHRWCRPGSRREPADRRDVRRRHGGWQVTRGTRPR